MAKSPQTKDVEQFLAALSHPRLREIRALRELILTADPTIREDIKWNAPSFRTSEFFATFHLRATEGVQLILHGGARKRTNSPWRTAIQDPESFLHWLADNRASLTFHSLEDVRARQSAFTDLIQRWVQHLSLD